MALLYYKNLGVEEPEKLMRAAFWGLRDFHEFLKTTKEHLTEQKKRLGWKSIDEEREPNDQEEVWVRLIEIPGASESFDSSLKSFFDENIREVYEMDDNSGDYPFNKNRCIKVLGRNFNEEKIQLERMPDRELLALQPNTYQIKCQMNAIYNLQNKPTEDHRPLLELFRKSKYATWADLEYHYTVKDWFLLHDKDKPGTEQQRGFVEVALNTPDFAFLDGPPGSGKTTVICELIMQLAKEGKRVLLCASTHVAVDNVLERLMNDNSDSNGHNILPVRIGDSSNVSEKAKQWQIKELFETEKKRIIGELEKVNNKTESQIEFLKLLRKGSEAMERIILESANLVCGTTIGILQHPDIKNRAQQSPQFDILIIDEASKTTFQEFLVPALLAKRWVLVGDPKQLSPYVDNESVAVNVSACLDKEYKRNACIDVFQAMKGMKNRITTLVIHEESYVAEYYKKQVDYYAEQMGSNEKGVIVAAESKTPKNLPYADIVVADKEFVSSNIDHMPLDIGRIRNDNQVLDSLRRRRDAYISMREDKGDHLESKEWETEVAWRLAREYEQRLNPRLNDDGPNGKNQKDAGERLRKDLQGLYPFDGAAKKDEKNRSDKKEKSTQEKIGIVQQIALPSILESLREGFEKNKRPWEKTALTDGLPRKALNQRLVRLIYQYRMHPDIADFPRRVVYQGEALRTHDSMKEEREWGYNPRERIVWHHVKGRRNKNNANPMEVEALFLELESFDEWARQNPNQEDRPWEVALLTFYRGQERALRNEMRKWTGQKVSHRHFHRGSKENQYMDIQVCTVDRFQGQEADLVLLSFSNDHPTSFLKSPNRLNVAITRARYRLVVFGNRIKMMEASGVLGEFSNIDWGTSIRQHDPRRGEEK